jgi:replication initiation and membrane attachment protein DnaB
MFRPKSLRTNYIINILIEYWFLGDNKWEHFYVNTMNQSFKSKIKIILNAA